MVPEDEIIDSTSNSNWADKVERQETITLDARQVDQMVASLGHCLTAVYAVIDAVEADGHESFKRERLTQANKSIEEAATLLDTLTTDLTT
ncbi:hypothetical protein MKK67_14440 [Methylobacterium sp. J-072]|uniref:hypothetical protein n=1 Tax=Methylobacterium sp. J-072 TaxID=2836651 RepID=UPI001FB9B6C6|nr:hypothetical protein [Methylobacterium sp. J-072]MCJ2093678.1 hypothetical protein [Methylobacterium sp. J-072]